MLYAGKKSIPASQYSSLSKINSGLSSLLYENALRPSPCTILCVKFNGEIDIVQFIFTQCVIYSLEKKISLHKKVEKYMKGINWRTLAFKKRVLDK